MTHKWEQPKLAYLEEQKLLWRWNVQQSLLQKQQKQRLAKIAARDRPQRPSHWTG